MKEIIKKIIELLIEYKLIDKIRNIIIESGILSDIKRQMKDFALVAVTQAEFSFNKIGEEKKKLAFQMICNYVKYPISIKPFKRIVENLLYNWISDVIENEVKKLKERLKNDIVK